MNSPKGGRNRGSSLYYNIHVCTHISSYDERLALWDTRNMATPLKDLPLGGGIWRIKWCPQEEEEAASEGGLLATACMHRHFALLETHLESGRPVEVVGEYKHHNSLAYGIDWCRKRWREEEEVEGEEERVRPEEEVGGASGGGMRTFTLASCSFYDHSMHVWSAALKTE